MELSYEQYAELMDELIEEGYDVLEASEMIFGYLNEMGQTRTTGQNSAVFKSTPGAGSASGQGGRRGSRSSASQTNQSVRLPGGRTATRVMSDFSSSMSAANRVPRSSNSRNVPGGGNVRTSVPRVVQTSTPVARPAAAAPTSRPTPRVVQTSIPASVANPFKSPGSLSAAGSAVRSTTGSSASTPAASTPVTTGKTSPSSTTSPTKPASTPMQQWAAANPKLAAAAAERERTRGTSATTNPLMRDMRSRMPAPSTLSPTITTTAFSKSTPALGTSTPEIQAAGAAAGSKPTTTGSTGFKISTDLRKTTETKKNQQKINAGMEIKGNELQEQLKTDSYGSHARPDSLFEAYHSIYNQ